LRKLEKRLEIEVSFKSAVDQSIPASKISGIYTGNLMINRLGC